MERAQAGDREAYEQLARTSAPRLFLIASRILRDSDAAEDAVQGALIVMWRDLPALRDPDRFEAWSYRLIIHQCHDHGRRERRQGIRIVELSEAEREPRDEVGDLADRDELGRAFDSLSRDHRTVIVLHHLVGLSIAEIADVLDVPYGTVGSRLHHAMRSLRAELDAEERSLAPKGQPA